MWEVIREVERAEEGRMSMMDARVGEDSRAIRGTVVARGDLK